MYGTIARFKVKPGKEEQMSEHLKEFEDANVTGAMAVYVYRMDADPNEYYVVVQFADKQAYLANASSPEQDARYRKLLDLLESEPEWHDGEIVQAVH